ncbi:MAG: hypothetical protein DIAAKJNI_00525 [Candidatus Argoarchaeum ethanivorans]|uniref:Uncharacterized protein n=1 Tax=Candidatus Argoarchaeum ethanivorans TaxID=2608793 RepID=A0A811TDU1_9EURY|nr:MAG: hypothetical protein DIAAKJNI_00525 [Candidatus Argoarchaeum ethanivorans]
MKSKTRYVGLIAITISALIVGIAIFTSGDDLLEKPEVSDQEQAANESDVIDETLRENHDGNVTVVIASEDKLLGQYEKSDRHFKKSVFNRTITYVHYRSIDDVPVDRDHRIYVFDKNTKALIRKAIYSRDDLPEHLPPVISKEQAESIAGGGSATLRFVSPQFFVSPPEQALKNPCWVVRSGDTITIIDATNGKTLGYGIPPP